MRRHSLHEALERANSRRILLRRRLAWMNEHAEQHRRHLEIEMQCFKLLQRQQDLKIRLRAQGQSSEDDMVARQELRAELVRANRALHELQRQRHVLAKFGDADMLQYHRHIRYTRPLIILLNLSLWALLFYLGGASTGIKLAVLLFAVVSTIGNLVEFFFLLKVRDRILTPVENLKRAVEAVAGGNYDVAVRAEEVNEMGVLIEAFNVMVRRLKANEELQAEYEENRKALIANISHDLKTPIASIQGYVEAILDRGDLPAERKAKYLKIIASNATYLNKLIDDLFLFAKLDMQKLDLNLSRVSIRPFLADLMEELELEFEDKGIRFAYEDALTGEYFAQVDAKRFHQVIRNITDNAVRYGPKTGLSIECRLYLQEGRLSIDVADNGPGIPREQLPHIFGRFYRVDPERTKDLASTGLGLNIAKELIEAHGGGIAVTSAVGAGSCFTISIPALNPADEGV